jgi:hypothetical protein
MKRHNEREAETKRGARRTEERTRQENWGRYQKLKTNARDINKYR